MGVFMGAFCVCHNGDTEFCPFHDPKNIGAKMLVKDILPTLKIAARISNPSSLTSLYRSLELGKTTVRAVSEFGNIELKVSPTGLNEAVLLDADSVLAVVQSLPQDGELTLTKTDTRLNWKCGGAKGHWNLVASEHEIPKLDHQTYPWEPPTTLGLALLLASSACQAAAVAVGLYGIVIEPDGDELKFLSSNSISLASATIPKGTYPAGKITLRPPVPAIIASLLSEHKCVLDVTTDGIFILSETMAAHLPLGAELDHDLKALAAKFSGAVQVAQVNTDAVKKFITRARALTDKNQTFNINLSVDQGKLVLEHSGMASATEETFLTAGLDEQLTYKSTPLPADMLLVPLGAVEALVLDYLGEQQLVLRGVAPEFLYVVSGGE